MATEEVTRWTLELGTGRGKIFLMIADDGAGGHDRDEHRSRGFLQFQYYFNYRYMYYCYTLVNGGWFV